MRIHTNLTFPDFADLTTLAGAPINFRGGSLTEHGSRTHARAFEVRLDGSGGRNNTGLYGAGDYDGATWDEWGAFFGALYAADPDARCGGSAKRPVYADAADFHFQTGDRFKGRLVSTSLEPGSSRYLRRVYLPADTHPRHSWRLPDGWSYNDPTTRYSCAYKGGCSATRPSRGQIAARRAELGVSA